MRISVALCVYNGERFLAEQLNSIGRQERRPDELVVSDDGSSDQSISIIERFAADAAFPVRILRNDQNLGVARNFEQAITGCRADVIVTADQDDLWYPMKLGRMESEFEASPNLGLIFTDADLIDDSGKSVNARLWEAVRFDESSRRRIESEAFPVLLRRPVITGATMAFRSSLTPLILPIGAGWLHDEWIGLMVSAASQLKAIAQPLMSYRRHSQNLVGVAGLGFRERTRTSLGRSREYLLGRADQFENLRDSLTERRPDRSDLRDLIDEKIDHLRARGNLPRQRILRLQGIATELTSGRYSRYSGSVLGFARDLLARD